MSYQQTNLYPNIEASSRDRPQDPSSHPNASDTTSGKAASKAGAYGGSEAGSMLGNMVGPPIIGGVIGNLIGERVGEKITKETGLDDAAGRIGQKVGGVIGQRNADKAGEIALSAFGYSEREECVCCPCLPASQTMLWVMIGFFIFNWYRLGVGIDFEKSCDAQNNGSVKTVTVPSDELVNSTSSISIYAHNTMTNETTYMISYPCEFGFHYLVSGSTVWLIILPFTILTLFGNCWRQCCCCLCDPIVCVSTIFDFIRRCCCEIKRFNCIDFIWYSFCTFHFIWACCALKWFIQVLYFKDESLNYEVLMDNTLKDAMISSIVLDLLIPGSEIFHKIRLFIKHEKNPTNVGTELDESTTLRSKYP
uniref:Uncharacterized protein n=1 Tax=Lepeophtheirus salmonis TaxID=72036 RepID=A0A0K2TH08_LEPSM